MAIIAHTFGGDVVWSFVSQFEVAEGLLLFGIALLFVTGADYLRRGRLFNNSFLRGHVKSPVSYAFVVLGILGALSFDLLVLCNFKRLDHILDVGGLDLVQYPLRFFGHFGGSSWAPGGRVGYGALALLVWAATMAFLSLGTGFARAMKLFAVPSILFLTLVVFLFDPGEMDSQAVNLISGVTFDGISLLSNWFLLTISLCVMFSTALHGALRKRF